MPARLNQRTRRTGHISAILKLRRTRRHILALICLLLLFVIYQLLSRRYDSGYAYVPRTSKLEMEMEEGTSSKHDRVYNLTSLSSNVTDTPSQSSTSNTTNTTTSPRELIKPPLVTREMYQRIARKGRQALLAQTEDEDELVLDDAYRYEFAFSQTNRRGGASSWPPVVSYIPEARIFPSSHVFQLISNSNTSSTSNTIPSNSSSNSSLLPAPLTTPPHPQSQSQPHSQLPPYDPRYPPSLCASLPTGCRFLLPLSIAEQESKARTHILQLIHLAHRLNRTVVLPDVSMGRLGACRKRPFGWYYESNIGIEGGGGGEDDVFVNTLEMNVFKRWLNSKFVRMQKGRIVTLDPAPPSPPSPPHQNATASSLPLGDPPPCSHPTLVTSTTHPLASLPGRSVYGTHKLAWCAARKFRKIDFDAYDPVVVRAHSEGCERGRDVGGEIGGVLEGMGMGVRDGWGQDDEDEGEAEGKGDGQGEDGHGEKGEGEVDVLAINWNLRRKIFYPTNSTSTSPPPSPPSSHAHASASPPSSLLISPPLHTFGPPPRPVLHLSYSTPLHALAHKLAPAPGVRYVGVHWRMETVDEEVLERCAGRLVDKLSGILAGSGSGGGGQGEEGGRVRDVWFATDYPYSVLSPLPAHVDIEELLVGSASASPTSPISSQLQDPRGTVTLEPELELGKKSTTFRDLGAGHHRAAHILRQAFSQDSSLVKEYGLRIWGLEERIAALSQANLTALELAYTNDTGALGILDKLVLVRSEVFLSGDEGCARKSSYTRQVEESRSKESGVERFGWQEEEGGNL